MAIQGEEFPHLDKIKTETELILQATPGAPSEPIGKIPSFGQEIVQLVNQGITFKYNAAHVLDSAGAFFSCENVGLPGIATYFKVAAVAERADAWRSIDFLGKRGARAELGAIGGISSTSWANKSGESDVLLAFVKALAMAKVSLQMENQAYKAAANNHDAQATKFFTECAESCSEKIRVWCGMVAHLKLVADDKHALKEFERELKSDTADFAAATAIEAVSPAKLQLGTWVRTHLRQSMDVEGGVFKSGRQKEARRNAQS